MTLVKSPHSGDPDVIRKFMLCYSEISKEPISICGPTIKSLGHRDIDWGEACRGFE